MTGKNQKILNYPASWEIVPARDVNWQGLAAALNRVG
jgi:hypothetical protein